MSKQKWLTNAGGSWRAESSMNSKVVLTPHQVNELATSANTVTVSSLVFGDYAKWCASLIYYPIILISDAGDNYKLNAGGIEYSAPIAGLIPVNAEFGFTLGEYKYPTASSYWGYEPYTKLEVYLPYYGFTGIKIADVQGQYMQFRLYVDWDTGQAQYVIGVNPESVSVPIPPYAIGIDDTNTKILGTYNFQLGVNVPIGTTNFNEVVRNTILGVGKAAATIGASFATESMPTSRTTETDRTVRTKRNAKTGRQKTMSTKVREKESASYTSGTGQRLNTAINTATTVLGNLSFSTRGITSNNGSLNNNLCPSVALVVTKAKTAINAFSNDNYKHLVGLPTCQFYTLGNCHGFTKVSDIHLESAGFRGATQVELAELESLVYQGIILPDPE